MQGPLPTTMASSRCGSKYERLDSRPSIGCPRRSLDWLPPRIRPPRPELPLELQPSELRRSHDSKHSSQRLRRGWGQSHKRTSEHVGLKPLHLH